MPKRMLRFDVTEFLEACRLAESEGKGVDAVCALLGITPQQVWNRRYQLRRKGVPLPRMRAAKPARVARAPRSPGRPAPANVSFVIEVNGGTHEV